MNTRDFILVGVGVALGFFVKKTLDNRNVVASTDGTGVQTLPSDENFVFSQKYKDCAKKIEEQINRSEESRNFSLEVQKTMIDACMARA